jgi:hypothetical protein
MVEARRTMYVTLNLPEAVEQRLRENAARNGQTLEEYLQALAVREALLPTPPPAPAISPPPGFMSRQEWSKAFREWVASHRPVDHFVDDSRESIYAGRGE